ncbi:MAG: replication initiator protein [Microvirus sp.]|nr:MAG: replication initiator protein [Microvirus sp.]
MPCYHPVLVPVRGYVDLRQEVACGRCVGCRVERKRAWAARCMHESQFHEASCFLTLTYRDENIPSGGTLVPAHCQLFLKRLRKAIAPRKVSFFLCGEYGENFSRPHYHVCLFGFDFPDKVFHKLAKDGKSKLYRSALLERLWPDGFSSIGSFNYTTAAYVAGYVMKKVLGEAASEHYRVVDSVTGEAVDLVPEFVRMSRRPAIGKRWYEQFSSDAFPDDFVVVDGKQHPVPKWYYRRLKTDSPLLAEDVRQRRIERAAEHSFDRTRERLRVRETVATAQFNQQRRNLS